MILKAIGWLLTIGIPALIFFDMVDATLLLFFGIFYGFGVFLQTIALGVLIFTTNDEDIKLAVKKKLEEETSKDSTLFQTLGIMIFDAFVVVMLWSASPVIAVIVSIKIILGIINLVFIDKIYNAEEKKK